MNDHKHPIWTIAKALVILAFATLFAKINAQEFDQTEITMLSQLAVILFGGAAVEAYFRKPSP
jgi:hypothetical protein